MKFVLISLDGLAEEAQVNDRAHLALQRHCLPWFRQMKHEIRRFRGHLVEDRNGPSEVNGGDGEYGVDADVLAAAELTARERQVLELIAEGLSNRQIGERLFISGKTASVHVSAILRKLGAATRTEAAYRAGALR